MTDKNHIFRSLTLCVSFPLCKLLLAFNEAVIMERDYIFKEIDDHLMKHSFGPLSNTFEGMIHSFSK